MNIEEHEKNLIETHNKRIKEWKEKNNLFDIKEGYEKISFDTIRLQDFLNYKIRSFKKENNCDLTISIVDEEIKIRVLIDNI
jgi:hypothetical protein